MLLIESKDLNGIVVAVAAVVIDLVHECRDLLPLRMRLARSLFSFIKIKLNLFIMSTVLH